jgi:hypothetical protein
MNGLVIQEVTEENWRATLDLAVFPEQQRFIADSVPIAAIALRKPTFAQKDSSGSPTPFCGHRDDGIYRTDL